MSGRSFFKKKDDINQFLLKMKKDDCFTPFQLVVYNGKFCLLLLKFIPLHLFIKILSKGYAVNLLFLLIR